VSQTREVVRKGDAKKRTFLSFALKLGPSWERNGTFANGPKPSLLTQLLIVEAVCSEMGKTEERELPRLPLLIAMYY